MKLRIAYEFLPSHTTKSAGGSGPLQQARSVRPGKLSLMLECEGSVLVRSGQLPPPIRHSDFRAGWRGGRGGGSPGTKVYFSLHPSLVNF